MTYVDEKETFEKEQKIIFDMKKYQLAVYENEKQTKKIQYFDKFAFKIYMSSKLVGHAFELVMLIYKFRLK